MRTFCQLAREYYGLLLFVIDGMACKGMNERCEGDFDCCAGYTCSGIKEMPLDLVVVVVPVCSA